MIATNPPDRHERAPCPAFTQASRSWYAATALPTAGHGVEDEFMVGFYPIHDSRRSEFAIKFVDLGDGPPTLRVCMFAGSLLTYEELPGLKAFLTSREDISAEELRAFLVGAGYVDDTAEVRPQA